MNSSADLEQNSGIDPAARVSYYAAGIMVWIRAHKARSLELSELFHWRQPTYDSDSEKYLGDVELLAEAVALLCELGFVEEVSDRYGPTVIVPRVELEQAAAYQPGTPFQKAYRFGESWIKRALIAVTEDRPNVSPAQRVTTEDSWEPLEIDREDIDFLSAVAKLGETVESIAQENGFAIQLPRARDNLVDHGRLIVKLAKDGAITHQQIQHNIIGAGHWLSSSFPSTRLDELGAELARWGTTLLDIVAAGRS